MAFFKRKTKEEPVKSLKAFVPGKVISITEVNDPVFSSKALGDGIAIQPAAQVITAPCDGVISMIAEESNHAIGMTLNNGVELLLHIGLDTVSLNGEGFCVFVKANDKVKQGDKLMEFDKALIGSKGFETTCILVVTNSDDYPKPVPCPIHGFNPSGIDRAWGIFICYQIFVFFGWNTNCLFKNGNKIIVVFKSALC